MNNQKKRNNLKSENQSKKVEDTILEQNNLKETVVNKDEKQDGKLRPIESEAQSKETDKPDKAGDSLEKVGDRTTTETDRGTGQEGDASKEKGDVHRKEQTFGQRLNQNELIQPALELMTNDVTITTSTLKANAKSENRFGIDIIRDVNVGQLKFNPDKTTLYRILTEIPSLIDYEVIIDEVNNKSILDEDLRTISEASVVKTSAEVFKPGALVIRYKQNFKIAGEEFPDVSDYKSSTGVLEMVNVKQARDSKTQRIDTVVTKLMNMIRAFCVFNRVVLAAPKKLIMDASQVNDEFQDIFRMNPAIDDKPHPYWVGPLFKIPWMKAEILRVKNEAPAQFGESEQTASRQNIKTTAVWSLAIDQYTAKLLALNFTEMFDNAIEAYYWLRMVRACIMPEIQDATLLRDDVTRYPLITAIPVETQNMYFIMLMVSKELKINILEFLTNEIAGTNRLSSLATDDVLDMRDIPSNEAQINYLNTLRDMLSTGSQMDPARLVVLETMPYNFDIKLTEPRQSTSSGNLMILAGLLSWFIVCPKLAVSLRCELGYHIMTALKNYFGGDRYGTFERIYGWSRRLINGEWRVVDRNRIPRYTRDTPDDWRPSIFSNVQVPNGVNQRTRDFFQLLADIEALCAVALNQIELDSKQQATFFPYYREDFTAYLSWMPMTLQDLYTARDGPVGTLIAALVDILNRADQMYQRWQGPNYRTSGTSTWFQSFLTLLTSTSNYAGPLYHFTLPQLSRWIMNGPFYVYDSVRREDVNLYPRTLGLGAEAVDPAKPLQGLPLPITLPSVTIDIMYPFRFLLTVQGDFKRPVKYSETIITQDKASYSPISRDGISGVNPMNTLSFFFYIVRMSERVALPMQLFYYLAHPDAEDNPITNVSTELRPVLIVSQWTHLMERLFAVAGASEYNAIFNVYKANGIIEPRYIRSQIVYINKNPIGQLLPIHEPGTIIERILPILTPIAYEKMNILIRLYLDDGSPFLNITRGFYLGRLSLEDRSPYIRPIVVNNQYPRLIDVDDIEYQWNETSNGRQLVVVIDGVNYDNPMDYRLHGIQILVNDLSDLREDALDFFTKGILVANFLIRVNNKYIKFRTDERSSKSTDFNEDMTYSKIAEILSGMDGDILEHSFDSTTYANNMTRDGLYVTGYLQWITLINNPVSKILATAITNTVQPRDNHIQLDPRNWGHGEWRGFDGMLPPQNVIRKIESGIVNMNNRVPTVLREAYNHFPEVNVIAKSFDNYL